MEGYLAVKWERPGSRYNGVTQYVPEELVDVEKTPTETHLHTHTHTHTHTQHLLTFMVPQAANAMARKPGYEAKHATWQPQASS